MILVTHFACCHQYKGYWRSCPLGWSYFTVMPGLNLRAGGAHAPEFTKGGADEILDQNNGTGGSTCIPMKTE